MSEPGVDATPIQRTALHAAHVEAGARMVPFAGYEMPVQYPTGVMAEHLHTRAAAGLFDVSHMGQFFIDSDEDPARALEGLVPGDLIGLAPGQTRYTLLLNDHGGILDDLMVSRLREVPNRLFVVVNAGRKREDLAHLRRHLGGRAAVTELPSRVLIAIQGPKAEAVLGRFATAAPGLSFMRIALTAIASAEAIITRSGYTGEDGFEISMEARAGLLLWRRLLAEPEVKPIGLGARDSLRLEAGLCLYGHDIDETTSPIEASLAWTIPKRRRAEGGFPGADRILRELAEGPSRRRVGIRPEGKAPAREGTQIIDAAGAPIGLVTSGGFGPSLGAPIAMGYVGADHAAPGTPVGLVVRGKTLPATIAPLPFTPHRYAKAS